jgi:predicted phosphoadenosine phosphosulfate sulfurtransferase
MYKKYSDVIEPYWVCLPLALRNAVSVYEPKWICWDKEQEQILIRTKPEGAIGSSEYFDFFEDGMENYYFF